MTAVAGGPVAAVDITGLQALTIFRPLVRLVASGTQSIPSGTLTAITFNGSEEIDTHNYHNPASSASRITPGIPGYYKVSGTGYITTTTTTVGVFVAKNGVAIAGGSREGVITTGTARGYYADAKQACNGIGDYFELMIEQNSGAAVLTNQSSRFSSSFEIEFIRSL